MVAPEITYRQIPFLQVPQYFSTTNSNYIQGSAASGSADLELRCIQVIIVSEFVKY